MPLIPTHVLAGQAVGDIHMNGHNLYMSVGLVVLDNDSFIASDGAGNIQFSGTSANLGMSLTLNGSLNMTSHALYLNSTGSTYLYDDGTGNAFVVASSLTVYPELTLGAGLDFNGTSGENASELGLQSGGDILFGDSTTQTTAA